MSSEVRVEAPRPEGPRPTRVSEGRVQESPEGPSQSTVYGGGTRYRPTGCRLASSGPVEGLVRLWCRSGPLSFQYQDLPVGLGTQRYKVE